MHIKRVMLTIRFCENFQIKKETLTAEPNYSKYQLT